MRSTGSASERGERWKIELFSKKEREEKSSGRRVELRGSPLLREEMHQPKQTASLRFSIVRRSSVYVFRIQ